MERPNGAGPGRHDQNAVSHGNRLTYIMCHKNGALAALVDNAHHVRLKLKACLKVESRKWLVQQYNIGIDRQRAHESNTLAHTA